MKTERKANHHQKNTPITLVEIISLLKPPMEVVGSNRHIIDGVNYELVKFVACFPRLTGECDRLLITAKLAEGARFTDLTNDALTLDEKSQSISLTAEVEHD